MEDYTAIRVYLQPIFLDRHGVLLCVLVQLISMYVVGSISGFALPWLSPRVKSLPDRRQKQLAIAVPVILLKAIVMLLIVDVLLSSPLFCDHSSTCNGGPALDYRFQTLYFVAISYIFEILQRPSSAELVAHHLYLQGLPCYYWFYLQHQPTMHIDLALRFFELMVLLGPGATDITSDITFLLYYTAPRSRTGLGFTKAMSWIATVMRAVQWIALTSYGYLRYNEAVFLLSSTEKVVFAISVALWVWTEVDEILKIRGMVDKFQKSLDKKTL
ncbi:hypothetical protein PFICI_01642 [Pestalotiopsis fici W106-1]|uniref:TLC domain-containing protein n=1 Tax=Pestalotiopsis fici (strain W106-1 / CGMCC3.15140) TaxID=1229662 RepID=W3XPB5_PESFW|nr:uncharacterized protein PFICI_01642 [Pestalotiopsis fici W106-1]ETS87814.1 hypothetical protein PFICI_01642 [Pestalotiopsis fici W106-1]